MMEPFSFLLQSKAILIGLGAVTLLISGVSFVAYDISTKRDRLVRRVETLCRDYRNPTRAPSSRRVRLAPPRLAGSNLPQGDALEIARRLDKFGIGPDHSVAVFLALRLSGAALLAMSLALISYRYQQVTGLMRLAAIAFTGGTLGWFLPHVVLHRMISRRSRAIERGLPDAIELLVIAVEAGLALEDGIDRIVGELRRAQPVLADELSLTSADTEDPSKP